MTRRHAPRLPSRPAFVERTAFDERNNVLFLLLGIVAVAERVLSVVPEIVQPPPPDESAEPHSDSAATRLLR